MAIGPVLAVAALLSAHSVPPEDRPLVKLRSTESAVRELIREGQRRSPTLAALVEKIERSDTIIYVARVHTLLHAMEGCLVIEGDGSPLRYLRVLLAIETPRERMIVVLAHELQHVIEVLEAHIPNERAAVEALFKRIGVATLGSRTGEQYETAAAQTLDTNVARELRYSSSARAVRWK
jgi:hypothetical protein